MDPADQPHQPNPRADRPDRPQQVRDQIHPGRLAAPLFRFSQLELPWALGPPDGRYLIRDGPGGEPTHILVLNTLAAAQRRHLLRSARKAQPEPEPEPVPTARATIVHVAEPLQSAELAAAWLREVGEAELAADVGVLNRALHSWRLASADPYVHPVERRQALVARVGFGAGEQVADGQWSEARELVAKLPRRRRVKRLEPQAHFAAVMNGRREALACEELALRARLDLDHGRDREAALQLLIALDAALAELPPDARVDELRDRRDAVAAAAHTALAGRLDQAAREVVAFVLGRLEAALRARAATSG